MKQGTQVIVYAGTEVCPKCGEESYGYTSKVKDYKNGLLIKEHPTSKKYCKLCAYTKGDLL